MFKLIDDMLFHNKKYAPKDRLEELLKASFKWIKVINKEM